LQGKNSHPINIKGLGRLRPIIQSSLSSFILFSPNPSFSNLLCSPPSSPRRLREFLVACRSQDNPRRTVPDGVPPVAANLGFRRLSCPRRLDRPQAVRLARAGSFSEWISDDRAIWRTRVFDRKKASTHFWRLRWGQIWFHNRSFDLCMGSQCDIDKKNVIMVNI
jgi:hypothetical protein